MTEISADARNGRQGGPAQLCVANRPASKWPPPGSWGRHRGTITQLYLDENRTLRDVMKIMARDYAHRGTVKMYKSRITEWGLRKYRKSISLAKVSTAPVKKQRQRARRNINISDRRRRPDLNAITQCLDRKPFWGRQVPMSNSVCSSASPFSCSTKPSVASLLTDHETLQEYSKEAHVDDSLRDRVFSVARPEDVSPATLSEKLVLVFSADFLNNVSSAILSHAFDCFHGTASVLPSAILPPSILLSQEQLFACISSYFDGSFGCGKWISCDDEASVSIGASGIVNNESYKFYNYCRTASQLLAHGSPFQARQLLSRAFGLVKSMLLTGDVHSLSRFLDSLMYLEAAGLVGIATQLQDFIYGMATCLLPHDHPWYLICKLITRSDAEVHHALLAQSWQCATDALKRSSGESSTAAVQCQVELVNRVYGNKDPVSAERILRGLLAQCEETHGDNDIVCLKVLVVLGYNLIDQQRPRKAEEVAEDVLRRARKAGPWSRAYQLEAFELAAWAQSCQGKQQLAECNQRKAVGGHIEQWGRDVTVLRRMVILESWLRDWGRMTDAQKLNVEILELIGPNDDAM